MPDRSNPEQLSAYGGPGWQPRSRTLQQEIGSLWAACGADTEYQPLKQVLLHQPGAEILASEDPASVQMLEPVNLDLARQQHQDLAEAYLAQGVTVHYVEPKHSRPNQMYLADLMFMTPQGCIVARPASDIRAGEEVEVSRALGRLGVPILGSVHGGGTFEGADAIWLDSATVLLGRGMRTNDEGIAQLRSMLEGIGIECLVTDQPVGTMHLMGQLRILDADLALAWPTRLALRAVEAMRARGIQVMFLESIDEALSGFALNMVTIAPRKVMMCAGNTTTRLQLEQAGVTCVEVTMNELMKAAGAVGCLTGVVEREPL